MSVELAPAAVGAPARRWKPYPIYKDLGVEWLREIPAGWNVNKIKFTSYVKGRVGWHGLRSDEFTDVGPFLVTGTDFLNGRINWETCHHFSEERYNEYPYIQLKENDLLITKDGTIGKVAIVEKLSGKASLNSGIMLIRPLKKHYMKEFMFWILNSNLFSEYNEYTKAGSTIQHLYQETFEDFSFPIPSSPEQRAIASFLDRQTAHLDTLISKKERLIALLEEKRAVLISSAVTKGLDPTVAMKDSGVEWLGKVPKHWEVWKISHGFKRTGSGTTPSTNDVSFYDGDIPWVTTSELRENIITDTISKLTEHALKEHSALSLYPAGTLLVAMYGATIGRLGILGITACTNQACCAFAEPMALDTKFTFYWLLARRQEIIIMSTGGGQPNINQEKLRALRIPAPSFPEQRAIASYLDRETAKIDVLIAKIHDGIEKLREYRTALISAAVTGNIDVREAV